MVRSTDRFLTTHTGSLPRPEDLIRIMYAKEEGIPVDPAALRRHEGASLLGLTPFTLRQRRLFALTATRPASADQDKLRIPDRPER